MSKRIVFFNHKGGVSKTTTVYNLGWKLAEKSKVLIVDGDPQCNLTSLILRDNFDKYYSDDETKNQNIKDGVDPAFSGRPVPISNVECITADRNRNLFLMAGHANLAEYDASLTFAQTSNNAIATLQNLPGAFNQLMELCEKKYDIEYTLSDLNPGLSAINQNLFLNSDYFVIPANPDPFSIMAIETLSTVLPRWGHWKNSATELFSNSAYSLRNGMPKFIGTIIQRFNIRNGKAAKPYRDNIDEIKNQVRDVLVPKLSVANMLISSNKYLDQDFCLEEIPDFGGLLPKSFEAGVPVYALDDGDINETGIVLDGLKSKSKDLNDKITSIATKIKVMTDE